MSITNRTLFQGKKDSYLSWFPQGFAETQRVNLFQKLCKDQHARHEHRAQSTCSITLCFISLRQSLSLSLELTSGHQTHVCILSAPSSTVDTDTHLTTPSFFWLWIFALKPSCTDSEYFYCLLNSPGLLLFEQQHSGTPTYSPYSSPRRLCEFISGSEKKNQVII